MWRSRRRGGRITELDPETTGDLPVSWDGPLFQRDEDGEEAA